VPSTSASQQIAMAIAEHNPKKLYKRNRGLLKMSHKELHEFASTPRTDLPYKIAKKHGHKFAARTHSSNQNKRRESG